MMYPFSFPKVFSSCVRVFLKEHYALAACIHKQLDACDAWAGSDVGRLYFLGVSTLEKRVLFRVYRLA
jgi:hypothetical protein